MRGVPTVLTEAVMVVSEFRKDWLADEQTVEELAEKWGVSTYAVKSTATRLDLPARKRGAKKRRDEPRSSPMVLQRGRWMADARGIQRWVPSGASR